MTTARILIITDQPTPTPGLLAAVEHRAGQGDCAFRLVVTNPAHAEFHLVHPKRHDAAERAGAECSDLVDLLRVATGCPVSGRVSIRHDPFDAVEEELLVRPADEVLSAVAEGPLERHVHHDLPHRLAHFGLPVRAVAAQPA